MIEMSERLAHVPDDDASTGLRAMLLSGGFEPVARLTSFARS